MSNKKKDYWQKRFEQLEEAQNRKGAEFMEDVERIYNKAIRETEKEITAWYARFANKEGITLTEAKRLLNSRELKEFRMSVEEYIEKGKTLNISDTWAKELERASSKVHVSRLEALKVQMQQQVETLTAFKADEIDKLMKDVYTDSYYKTAFEVQKGIGVGWEVHRLDTDALNKVLAKPWTADGSNFSQRIWGKQRPELIKYLHDELSINIAQGKDVSELVKKVEKRFNVDRSHAARLVYTEKAYFQSLAQLDSFKELGVEEFEVCATLDNKTSEICQEMDGKHFPLKEFQVGVTAPPFHCYCRTATCPYFDDEFTIDETRAARDKEGKYYTVPSNLKYKDWKEAFVDNAGEGFVENISKYGFKEFTRPLAEAVVQSAVKDIVETVLGIQKNAPMTLTEAVKGANPYYEEGNQYKVNCQRCVQAYELRRRGYDVIACAKPTRNNTINWGSECFIEPEEVLKSWKAYTFEKTEKQIRDMLESAEDGARFSIYVKWKRGGGAHVFIAEKENGIVKYIDPQNGRENVSYYFDLGSKKKFGFFRLDDKAITTDKNVISSTVEVKKK